MNTNKIITIVLLVVGLGAISIGTVVGINKYNTFNDEVEVSSPTKNVSKENNTENTGSKYKNEDSYNEYGNNTGSKPVTNTPVKPAATETKPVANTTSDKCIITIQGGHYDVTEFRYQHPGGNIYKCGTDMTAAFQGKHKGYLPMIAKFKVD